MAIYSSRMYGLKVKERVNYFPFGDSKGKVTLSYSDGLWIIKAGDTTEEEAPENVEWWFNGTKFQNGETIITFNDGDVITYNIMETHTDVIPYKNYVYDIYGGSAENINYGTEDISYKITPFDSTGRFYKSIKVYETKNGLISSDKVINSIDIVNNKRVYDKPLKAYNMLFDWIDNKFKIISDSNYIKYNGNPVSKGFTIRIVEPDNFDEFEVTDETNKHYAKEVGKDAVPKITLCKRNGGKNIATNTKDRNTIYSDVYHDHIKAYYNGKYHNAMYLVWDTTGAAGCWKKTIKDSLVITYAHPYWFLMTTKDGVEYNGTTYLARKLIRTWKPETVVDMTLRRQKTRRLEKPADGNFDKIIYDVYEDENSDSVTVKYQKVVSRTEYIDLDSATFSSSAGSVLFHNIEFRCRNGKWTIYSKCGFITYGGRKYLKNKAILSFNVAEAIHININDESNKYVIDTVTTWRIRTPDSDVTLDYVIHTSESAKTLKVVKSTNGEEEPWITVYYYEAIHQAYEVDDISFKYDVKKQGWELYSNSDKLYYNGENRKIGELLKTWKYNEIVKISGISVTHTDTDSIMVEKKQTSTGGMISNNDVDEDIDWYSEEEPDLHISYAYSKNVWKITALRECFVSGTRYSERDVISTFKSKEPISSFTVMVPHDDEGEIVNVLYSFDVLISIKGVTTVHVDSHRYGEKSYTDKDVNSVANETMIFTTQDAKSMYGYIWKRFDGPPPPTDKSLYIVVALYKQSAGSAIASIYSNSVPLEITVNNKFSQSEPGVINTGHFNKVTIDGTTHVFWSRTSGSSPTYVVDNYGNWANRVVYYMNDTQVSISYCVLLQNGDIVYQYDASSSETVKGKYTISYIHDVCRITITDPVVILEQSFAWLSLWTTFIVTNDGFVSIDFDGGWKNSRLTGFKYYDGTISQINNNIEALNAINAELSGSGCTVLADHFEGSTAIRFGSSIVSNCRIGKYTPTLGADLDMSYYGQVIMKYDFGSNIISYYNRYSTKQLYEKVYSANNKKYLWTSGPYWTYIASTSPVTIDIGGDLKYYLYEMESVDDYLTLPAPISTQERDVNRSGLIPSVVNPTIDINRLDSDTPFKISPLTTFDILDTIPIKPGPVYSDYTDKVIIHQNGIVAVLDTVSFSQAANNFAWSLDNYGINNDYN